MTEAIKIVIEIDKDGNNKIINVNTGEIIQNVKVVEITCNSMDILACKNCKRIIKYI